MIKSMKSSFFLIHLMIVVILFILPVDMVKGALADVEFYYVAGVNGNDSNNGTRISTAFKTIKKAKDVVRTVNGSMIEDIVVYIRGGFYYLGEDSNTSSGLAFDANDSGKNGYKVMYANYNNESVTIVGGKRITGWTLDSGNVYKANVGTNWKFYELVENGSRCTMARTPNTGYIQIQQPVAGNETTKFIFKSGDLSQNTSDDYSDAQVYVWPYADWQTNTDPISSIDWDNRTVTLYQPTDYAMEPNDRYFMRGAKSFLDQPGEYYLDESTGYLYYYPRATPIGNQTIVAPTTDILLKLKGSSSGSLVQNLEFRGLTFTVSNFSKGRVGILGNKTAGMVYMENACNNAFVNCNFTNAGYNGVVMRAYNQNNKLIGNTFDSIGYHGIFLSGWSPGQSPSGEPNYISASASDVNKNNVVTRNKITNCGKNMGDGSGIMIIQSGSNEISYNEISGAPRYGISQKGNKWLNMQGQTYYGTAVTYDNHWDFLHTRNNNIKFNDVSNVLQDSQDAGGIESWGTGKGNIIDNNRIHDISLKLSSGKVIGVYLDDCSDYFTVKNNIIYGISAPANGSTCAARIKGIYNTITNNIFADYTGSAWDMSFAAYSGERNDHLTLTKNILYKLGGNQYYHFDDWSSDKITQSDYNVFYHPSGSDNVYWNGAANTWANWKLADSGKYDGNSSIADPLFINSANHDYTLQMSSPALSKGFVNINQKEIGICKNPNNTIEAEVYDNMFGVNTHGNSIGNADGNDWLYYKNFDFGSGEDSSFQGRVAVDATHAGKNVEIRLDSLTGTLIGTLTVANTGSYSTYTTQSTSVTGVTGKHDLYLIFRGGNGVCVLDWFKFM